jgi:ribonuclease Z
MRCNLHSILIFSPEVFDLHPEILECPVVVVECTFLVPEHLSQAQQSHHTHWSQIEQLVKKHENVTFILIHFSLRYKDADIELFFNNLPGGKPKNVVPWI